jgi:hypothetical protein
MQRFRQHLSQAKVSKILYRNHHFDINNVKVVIQSDSRCITLHSPNQYILDWKITDGNGHVNPLAYHLNRVAHTKILENTETESLIIPHLIHKFYHETDKWLFYRISHGEMQIKTSKNKQTLNSWLMPDYRRYGLAVNLWLIPPSVLAMMLSKESEIVIHKCVRIF